MEGAMVEELKRSDKSELLDLFTQAFAGYPLILAFGTRTKNTMAVAKAFLDFFGGTKSSLLLGIRKDDRLICGSLSMDSTEEPSVFASIRLFLALWRALGWRAVIELEKFHKEEPKYDERYLELVVLGTLPAFQRQGFGRRMLQFLYNEAKRRGYKGIVLNVDRDTPAFRFYLKEGFSIDKEFTTRGITLCWMRLVF